MGRTVDVDELVGAKEIADRLGVARPQAVYAWRRRAYLEFPEPVLERSIGLLWLWPEVEAWAWRTGRLGPHSDT
jgi:predicted DNA-binding transcriptional regulator AlpA